VVVTAVEPVSVIAAAFGVDAIVAHLWWPWTATHQIIASDTDADVSETFTVAERSDAHEFFAAMCGIANATRITFEGAEP
jgi:hypothetical protein